MLMNIDTYFKQELEKLHFTTFRLSLWSLMGLFFLFFCLDAAVGGRETRNCTQLENKLCTSKFSGGGESSRHALCVSLVSAHCALVVGLWILAGNAIPAVASAIILL